MHVEELYFFPFNCIGDSHTSLNPSICLEPQKPKVRTCHVLPWLRKKCDQDTEMNTAYRCFLPRVTGLAENVDHPPCCLDELTSHTVGVPDTDERCRSHDAG